LDAGGGIHFLSKERRFASARVGKRGGLAGHHGKEGPLARGLNPLAERKRENNNNL